MVLYPGTENVEFARCKLCRDILFDDHKDDEHGWTKGVTAHLALAHSDRYRLKERAS